MLLNDRQIRERCFGLTQMLKPFSEAVSGGGVVSYGLSHAGYDLRLGPEILAFKATFCDAIDPKLFSGALYQRRVFDKLFYSKGFSLPDEDGHPYTEMDGNRVLIPAGGYILGRSYEYIQIPADIKGRCVGKSTYARCGIVVNTTPLEPGWCGHLTIEIGNITPCPAVVYVMEGIAQLEFDRIEPPEKDYAGKKYQGQSATPVPARIL